MITKHLFGFLLIVPVLLGVWMDVASGMSTIQLIPQYPVIQGSVTLSVTGITGKLESVTWYRGSKTDSDQLILAYHPAIDKYPVNKGCKYDSRMTPHPNGSLQISNLITKDEGNYTVRIQTYKAEDIRVYLKIYDYDYYESTSMNTLIIGFISGIVFLLVLAAVLAFLFVRHRRHKKQSNTTKNEGPVYENVKVPQPHTKETILPGIPVQPSQESHYEQLTHKDKALYSTLASTAGK